VLVPEQLCVVGIDDEEMTQALIRTPLTSVRQGCKRMGYLAAQSLHRKMQGLPMPQTRMLVKPETIQARASSEHMCLTDPYVMQALHYIRNNACKGIKSEQVCDFVQISRSNLERRFRDQCGHSIHQALHDTRLEQAKNLLTQNALSTAEIAAVCGYPSVQYLHNVFKKDLGITPKSFRLQQAQSA